MLLIRRHGHEVLITGIDSMQILDQVFWTARALLPERAELYKTWAHFDGTAHRPQVLG